MRRIGLACLWGGSLIATWLIVRAATTEAPAETTSVAPVSTRIRTARAEPRPALHSPSTVEAREDDPTAFRDALATLERDLADGRWSVEDRDRLNASLRSVTREQAGELYDVLFPKLNAGTVISELEGPPI